MIVRNARYPALSPDGRWIAMSREVSSGLHRIAVAPIENPSQVKYLTGEGEGVGYHVNPTWSPDGQQICYADSQDLWVVSNRGGDAKRITQDAWVQFDPAWAPDGRHIYFSSYREDVLSVWRVRPDGTRLSRVTFGTGPIGYPCFSRDGKRMFSGSRIPDTRLVLQNVGTGAEHFLNDCNLDIFASLAFDMSSVVFVCPHRRPAGPLWVRRLENGVPAGPAMNIPGVKDYVSNPALSRDGKWVAYYTVGENRDIFVVSAGGGEPTRVTDDAGRDMYPAWSPNGSSLAFCSEREGNSEIWLTPMNNGRPSGSEKRLTGQGINAFFPWFSPDGKQVAFVRQTPDELDLWLVPSDGSAAPRRLTNGARVQRVRWLSADTILASGSWGEKRTTLRVVSTLNGNLRPYAQPANFGSGPDTIGIFDVSTDGSLLVYCRDEAVGDLWMLESNRESF